MRCSETFLLHVVVVCVVRCAELLRSKCPAAAMHGSIGCLFVYIVAQKWQVHACVINNMSTMPVYAFEQKGSEYMPQYAQQQTQVWLGTCVPPPFSSRAPVASWQCVHGR